MYLSVCIAIWVHPLYGIVLASSCIMFGNVLASSCFWELYAAFMSIRYLLKDLPSFGHVKRFSTIGASKVSSGYHGHSGPTIGAGMGKSIVGHWKVIQQLRRMTQHIF